MKIGKSIEVNKLSQEHIEKILIDKQNEMQQCIDLVNQLRKTTSSETSDINYFENFFIPSKQYL